MYPKQWETQKLLYLLPITQCPSDKNDTAAIRWALTTANQLTFNRQNNFNRWEDIGIPILQIDKPTLRSLPS